MVKRKKGNVDKSNGASGSRIFVYSGSQNEDEKEMATVNIFIAKTCQFRGVRRKRGGVANKSGGCTFPGRGKYLNRCALTHERRGRGEKGRR